MPFLCGISSLVALARLAILDQGNEILSRRHTRCPWHGSLEPPRPRTAHRTSTQSLRAHTQSSCSIYVSHPGYFWSQLRGALPPRHIPGSRDHFAREREHITSNFCLAFPREQRCGDRNRVARPEASSCCEGRAPSGQESLYIFGGVPHSFPVYRSGKERKKQSDHIDRGVVGS